MATQSDRFGSARPLAWLFAIVALSAAVYRPALDLSFVGDDFIILHVLRQAKGLGDPLSYLRMDFFGFYRPAAFLSQALDWELWGNAAVGFHLTSLLLHLANVVLVFTIGRKLLGQTAAIVAALLFALHPSNHEAVFWVASRFDLLATFFMLLALFGLLHETRNEAGTRSSLVGGLIAVAFALALLSKESAFAFLPIALGYDAFFGHPFDRKALGRTASLFAIVAVYLFLRAATTPPAVSQNIGKPGKALLLVALLTADGIVLLIGRDAFFRAVIAWRTRLGIGATAALALVLVALAVPQFRVVVAPKLAFASFAGFYLLSPIITLGNSPPPTFDPAGPWWPLAGWLFLVPASVALVCAWRPPDGKAAADGRHAPNAALAFLFVFVMATLLPVSSMTEGKRYLYMASIGISWLAGWLVARLKGRRRVAALALACAVLVISVWQIRLKASDWRWASDMTAATIRLAHNAEPDPCNARDILLLTAPVNVRDVYCNFYNYTFEDPSTGCHPRDVRAVVRVVGDDVTTTAAWTDTRVLTLALHGKTGRLVTSWDLRHFDVPLSTLVAAGAPRLFATQAGTLVVSGITGGYNITLALDPSVNREAHRLLYYTSGQVRELER